MAIVINKKEPIWRFYTLKVIIFDWLLPFIDQIFLHYEVFGNELIKKHVAHILHSFGKKYFHPICTKTT